MKISLIYSFAAGVGATIAVLVNHFLRDDISTTNALLKIVVAAFAGGAVGGFIFGWFTQKPYLSKLKNKQGNH